MQNHRLRYIYHLDNIRSKKKVTITNLCKDICDRRQYTKYLSGENNISDTRIIEFCNVLGVSARDFYYTLNEKDIYDFSKLRELYYHILDKRYNDAINQIEVIDKIDNLSFQNTNFFTYCKTRFKYENKIINEINALTDLSKIINYPDCKKNEVFDFVDIITLMLISEIEIKKRKTIGLKFLTKILRTPSHLYLSLDSRSIIPTIYSAVSLLLGRLKRYEDCIEISKAGISYCTENNYSKSLTWLYYYLALSYKHTKKTSLSEKYAALCFSNVLASNNPSKVKLFFSLISTDFNKDPFLIILDSKMDLLGEEKST